MRPAFGLLAILLCAPAPASAQMPAAHPQPIPGAGRQAVELPPAVEAARVQQEAFDARIARKSERAVRSICAGCEARSVTARRARADRRAAADSDGTVDERYLVEDPANAPIE